jgi:hypothetical protein
MPPAEIPQRIAEARRRMVWRRKTSGWRAFESVGDGELADLQRCADDWRDSILSNAVMLCAKARGVFAKGA